MVPIRNIKALTDKTQVTSDRLKQEQSDFSLQPVRTNTNMDPPEDLKRLHDLYPAVRIRSPKGRVLDTDSQYQRNIRLAKLCHVLGLSEFLTEWRLPKIMVPSRPDFSRVNPTVVYKSTFKESAKIVDQKSKEVQQRQQDIVSSHYHLQVSLQHSPVCNQSISFSLPYQFSRLPNMSS